MDPQSVEELYRGVIDDVVQRSRRDFVQEGIDETVLEELRILWEQKLAESGCLRVQQEAEIGQQAPGVHAEPYMPAAPTAYSVQRPYNSSSGPASISYDVQLGKPEPVLHPIGPVPDGHHFPVSPLVQPTMVYGSHVPPMGYVHGTYGAFNTAVDTRKRIRHENEQVGPAAKVPNLCQGMNVLAKPEPAGGPPMAGHPSYLQALPQQDGADDEDNSGGKDEDEDKTEGAHSGEALSADDSDEDEESDIKNIVLAQFEKVSRSRNKWKCTLKDGVMHIDGREYLFSTAFGDMQF
eukprot:jgi/Botrbrau1/8784/Bobra.0330s0016.1